jgi:hypothetical protein
MKDCGVRRGSRVGLLAAAVVVVGSIMSGGYVFAAEEGAGIKIPETASEHLAMAQSYREKVETYRQEVETHQHMLAAYKRRVAVNPKSPGENPWLKNMRKHCERYITEARQLAAEAQKFADYHELRGKELQGQ